MRSDDSLFAVKGAPVNGNAPVYLYRKSDYQGQPSMQRNKTPVSTLEAHTADGYLTLLFVGFTRTGTVWYGILQSLCS